jgi:hypothetical protein
MKTDKIKPIGKISDEYEKSVKLGKLTEKTIEIINYYSSKMLDTIRNEWKPTEKQMLEIHNNGLKHVKENWNRFDPHHGNYGYSLYNYSAYIFTIYSYGLSSYIREHKKLI